MPTVSCTTFPNIPTPTLSMYYDPQVMDEEMEAQAGYKTCPRPHS